MHQITTMCLVMLACAAVSLPGSPRLLSDMHIQPPREPAVPDESPFIIVLGIAQDGGYPQPGCAKQCCAAPSHDHARARHVSSLALVDPKTGQRWIFDCTPDFREQLRLLDEVTQGLDAPNPPTVATVPPLWLEGIFLTHAHIGHYTGLIFLGHEVMGAHETPVYAMPRMREFLSTQGPWDQLVRYKNIVLRDLEDHQPVRLNDRLTVTPIRVPHREEYSEVVGFRIDGPNRSALFIPDIDKWERWDRRIEDLIAEVDVAYLDGTFFADGELADRDMSQIPHPFIEESIDRFAALAAVERAKIRFIHLNHTNPALDPKGAAREAITDAGFSVAGELERVGL